MGFVALVAGNLGLIFAHRSPDASFTRIFRSENPALWWVVGSALAALAVTVYWPPLQGLFGFAPIDARDLALAFAVGIAAVILFSALRVVVTRGSVRRAA
jgi:magnesium-transporting ATPase (P-type)